MTEPLEPCPFCGDRMQITNRRILTHLNPDKCIIGPHGWHVTPGLIAKWNNRGRPIRVFLLAIEAAASIVNHLSFDAEVSKAELDEAGMLLNPLLDGAAPPLPDGLVDLWNGHLIGYRSKALGKKARAEHKAAIDAIYDTVRHCYSEHAAKELYSIYDEAKK